MKTAIYYFSGTGNSLKIATDLGEKLGDSEIIPIFEDSFDNNLFKFVIHTPPEVIGWRMIGLQLWIKNLKKGQKRY